MSGKHFITKCRDCEKVMGQCRCPASEKEVTWDRCGCAEDHREFFRNGIETIAGQRREIKILNDRIKSLEEGECRFHCRMRKDMWKEGYTWRAAESTEIVYLSDACLTDQYNEWREHKNERNTRGS